MSLFDLVSTALLINVYRRHAPANHSANGAKGFSYPPTQTSTWPSFCKSQRRSQNPCTPQPNARHPSIALFSRRPSLIHLRPRPPHSLLWKRGSSLHGRPIQRRRPRSSLLTRCPSFHRIPRCFRRLYHLTRRNLSRHASRGVPPSCNPLLALSSSRHRLFLISRCPSRGSTARSGRRMQAKEMRKKRKKRGNNLRLRLTLTATAPKRSSFNLLRLF